MRLCLSILAAALVSGCLFLFMGWLVRPPAEVTLNSKDAIAIEFVRSKQDSEVKLRDRRLPKKPKPVAQPKVPKMAAVQDTQTPLNNMPKLDMPPMDMPLALGGGPYLGQASGAMANNQDIVPLVRIEPQYPRKAAMAGKEGWVELSFDIDAIGKVSNIKVLRAEPRRLFDSSARRALKRWKYQPKKVDGKAVARAGNKVRIDFKLER